MKNARAPTTGRPTPDGQIRKTANALMKPVASLTRDELEAIAEAHADGIFFEVASELRRFDILTCPERVAMAANRTFAQKHPDLGAERAIAALKTLDEVFEASRRTSQQEWRLALLARARELARSTADIARIREHFPRIGEKGRVSLFALAENLARPGDDLDAIRTKVMSSTKRKIIYRS